MSAPAAATEKPKTMKVIFVEDIAQTINDLAGNASDDGSWTSEILQMCILKAANIHGAPVVFKHKSVEQPKEEGAAPIVTEEIVPIYQSTVFDVFQKDSKNENVYHSFNLFTVNSAKNQKSKFVKEAKNVLTARAPEESVNKLNEVDADDEDAPTLVQAEKQPAKKPANNNQQNVVYASLDWNIRNFHANERKDTLPHTVVTPGDSRLVNDKFQVAKATFYSQISLLQQHKKQRQQEVAEYQLALNSLTRFIQTGKRLTKEQISKMEVTIDGKKFPVSENFADRLDEETEALAENAHPRNKSNFIKKFERMWNMVERFNPQLYVKEVPVPTPSK